MSLDRQMLQAYQSRWQAVEQVKQAEWQAATVTERWRQLNALLRRLTNIHCCIPVETADG